MSGFTAPPVRSCPVLSCSNSVRRRLLRVHLYKLCLPEATTCQHVQTLPAGGYPVSSCTKSVCQRLLHLQLYQPGQTCLTRRLLGAIHQPYSEVTKRPAVQTLSAGGYHVPSCTNSASQRLPRVQQNELC